MHLPYNISTFQLFNRESSVEFLLKNVRHIIMFNLIIANLDVKMRPRPAANPHQQEKKTRKYYIHVMFQFAGNTIKNDAKKILIFSPIEFFC